MKKTINHVTYNTNTAKAIAVMTYGYSGYSDTLYKTPKGKFFVYSVGSGLKNGNGQRCHEVINTATEESAKGWVNLKWDYHCDFGGLKSKVGNWNQLFNYMGMTPPTVTKNGNCVVTVKYGKLEVKFWLRGVLNNNWSCAEFNTFDGNWKVFRNEKGQGRYFLNDTELESRLELVDNRTKLGEAQRILRKAWNNYKYFGK